MTEVDSFVIHIQHTYHLTIIIDQASQIQLDYLSNTASMVCMCADVVYIGRRRFN